MIEELIKSYILSKKSNLNFNKLLEFMESSGFYFINKNIKDGASAITTPYSILLDMTNIKQFPDNIIFFIILHEIAHAKRIKKIGKEVMLKELSLEDFDEFSNSVIREEIICDRYASIMFYSMNNYKYPSQHTQELHLPYKKEEYKELIRPLFGVIKNNEENYLDLINTFIIK